MFHSQPERKRDPARYPEVISVRQEFAPVPKRQLEPSLVEIVRWDRVGTNMANKSSYIENWKVNWHVVLVEIYVSIFLGFSILLNIDRNENRSNRYASCFLNILSFLESHKCWIHGAYGRACDLQNSQARPSTAGEFLVAKWTKEKFSQQLGLRPLKTDMIYYLLLVLFSLVIIINVYNIIYIYMCIIWFNMIVFYMYENTSSIQ